MNLKKYLRKRAEKDAEALITENDRLFCLQLAPKVLESEKQKSTEKSSKNDTVTKKNK